MAQQDIANRMNQQTDRPGTGLSRRTLLRNLGILAGTSRLAALPFLLGENSTALPTFEEIPPSLSGITWTHTAGKSAAKHLPETSGAGCAFLDYDNDGWMDIYLVNSGKADFYDPPRPLRNALYRNNRDGTFTDVTERAGVGGGGYGMGVAVGDYDGDGFPDIYVTQFGRNILYHNNGDGTFTDVTEKAGVAAAGWSSSAVWFDYDNDGKLDLFVCQFAEFDAALGCGTDAAGVHHYCIPRIFKPRPSWLFHNNGDGTFTDVSKETGIAAHLGKAWGVVATDINNDGNMDLFVANDTVPNFSLSSTVADVLKRSVLKQMSPTAQKAAPARAWVWIPPTLTMMDGWTSLSPTLTRRYLHSIEISTMAALTM